MSHLVCALQSGALVPMIVINEQASVLDLGYAPQFTYEIILQSNNIVIFKENFNQHFRILFADLNAIIYRFNSDIPYFYEMGEIIPYQANLGANVVVSLGWLHANNSVSYGAAVTVWQLHLQTMQTQQLYQETQRTNQLAAFNAQRAIAAENARLLREQELIKKELQIKDLEAKLAVFSMANESEQPTNSKKVVAEKEHSEKERLEKERLEIERTEKELAKKELAEKKQQEALRKDQERRVLEEKAKQPPIDPETLRLQQFNKLLNIFPRQIEQFCKVYRESDAISVKTCAELLFSKEKCVTKEIKRGLFDKLLSYSEDELATIEKSQNFINIAAHVIDDKELKSKINKKFTVQQNVVTRTVKRAAPKFSPSEQLDKALIDNDHATVKNVLDQNPKLLTETSLCLPLPIVSTPIKKIILQKFLKLDPMEFFKLNQAYKIKENCIGLGSDAELLNKMAQLEIWLGEQMTAIINSLNLSIKPNTPLNEKMVLLLANHVTLFGRNMLMTVIAARGPVALIAELIKLTGETILLRDQQQHGVFHFITKFAKSEYIKLIPQLCDKFDSVVKEKKQNLMEQLNARDYSKGNTFMHSLMQQEDAILVLAFLKAIYTPKRSYAYVSCLLGQNSAGESISTLIDGKEGTAWAEVREFVYNKVQESVLSISKQCDEDGTAELYFPSKSAYFYINNMDKVFYMLEDMSIEEALPALSSRYSLQSEITKQYDIQVSRLNAKAKETFIKTHAKVIAYFKRGNLFTLYENVTLNDHFVNFFIANPDHPFEERYMKSNLLKEVEAKMGICDSFVWRKMLSDLEKDPHYTLSIELLNLIRCNDDNLQNALMSAFVTNNLRLLMCIYSQVGFVPTDKILAVALCYAPDGSYDLLDVIFTYHELSASHPPERHLILSNSLFLTAVVANRSVSKTRWLVERNYNSAAPSPIPEQHNKRILEELFDYYCNQEEGPQYLSLQGVYELVLALCTKNGAHQPDVANTLITNMHDMSALVRLIKCALASKPQEAPGLHDLFKFLLNNGSSIDDITLSDGQSVFQFVLSRNSLEFLDVVVSCIKDDERLYEMLHCTFGATNHGVIDAATDKHKNKLLDEKLLIRLKDLKQNVAQRLGRTRPKSPTRITLS